MSENFRFAFQGIWAHKMRSFLTMLGVIIGIASIIAIVSTIQGTNRQIMDNLVGAGNNCVTVSLWQGDSSYYFGNGNPEGVYPVTEDIAKQISEISHVEKYSFYNSRQWMDNVRRGTLSLSSGSAIGADRNYMSTNGYVIYRGRGFVDQDYKNFRKVVVLDEVAATALFPGEDPVGQTIDIRNIPFTVIGLYRKSEAFKPVIETIQDYYTYNQSQNGSVIMPDACWPILFQFDEPQNCVIRTTSTEDMSRAGTEAAQILNSLVRESASEDTAFSYRAEDVLETARKQQELNASTNSLLVWVASIALLVGGIGVMNIMLVSVTERTSEIGLKKALGARKRNILLQFLTESAVLTSIGGILGIIAGII
ncbi:MAG: ABC transporter permease, partial [Lachnospiraceae bacterium]|nr:ABC transporter permease [Lachnospiraceae bacterium]